jgi:hypothetical protein
MLVGKSDRSVRFFWSYACDASFMPIAFIRQITQTSIVPIARRGCAGSKTERRDELRSNGVVVIRESRLIIGNITFTVLTVILFNLFSNPSYSLQICSTSIKGIATARW